MAGLEIWIFRRRIPGLLSGRCRQQRRMGGLSMTDDWSSLLVKPAGQAVKPCHRAPSEACWSSLTPTSSQACWSSLTTRAVKPLAVKPFPKQPAGREKAESDRLRVQAFLFHNCEGFGQFRSKNEKRRQSAGMQKRCVLL